MDNLKSISIRIGGMTCVHCRDRIEQKLKSTVGIEDAAVDFAAGTAAVTYNTAALAAREITAAIEELGYQVLDDRAGARGAGASAREIAGTLVIILALYVLLRSLGLGALTGAFPLAEAGMGYGMLVLIGLVTSVHCVAMCGGINLSQCIPAAAAPEDGKRREALVPAVLYNAGRVISYTAVGTLAGALGAAITLPGRFQGLVQLAAGVFMVIMGINMLGFFRGSIGTVLRRFTPRMPKVFARKIYGRKAAGRNPLLIGLLNGFMPCGPLQAMQLYALSTGNPVAGGLAMFLFSMGTVPLMFGVGALGSLLSRTAKGPVFRRRVMKAGAVLVTVMGLTMFTYGFGLSGFTFNVPGALMAAVNPAAIQAGWKRGGAAAPAPFQIENGVQIINSTLSPGRYPAITVQAGIPVKWTIDAPAGSINGCNNRMIIREYRIEHRFTPGENVIEFTPAQTGRFPYSCWMGMIRSSITVVAEGQAPAETAEPDIRPSPAGTAISTDTVALAELQANGYQTIKMELRDDGVEPAVLILRRGVPAAWTINNDSLDPGNSRLIFPAYSTRLDMDQGDNVIQLMPLEDFDFSTADNVFYGYVKVVDDLDRADIEAIKAEVADFEPLIYPDAYFDAAAQGAGCCARP